MVGGVMMELFPNSERVECVKFNSFRVGKHCLLLASRLASRVIRIQSFQDLVRYQPAILILDNTISVSLRGKR